MEVGAAGSTSGLVIVLILVLAPWCPEQIMKEEKRGQGGAQAADFCPSDWARAGGEVGRGVKVNINKATGVSEVSCKAKHNVLCSGSLKGRFACPQ